MSKTRVVLLIPTLDRSGAEKQFTLLATKLPRDEFDVRAIALTRGGPYEAELQAAGVPLTVIGKRAKFDPFSFWRLRDELKRHDPDILHTWLFAANAYGRLCARAIPRAKIVVSERCVDSWKSGWQLWLDRRLISRTDRLVGNSPSVVEFYRELGVPPEKLVCISNGIDANAYTPVPSPRPVFNNMNTGGERARMRGEPLGDDSTTSANSPDVPHSAIVTPHSEEPLTLTLSPPSRGEGTRQKNRDQILAELNLPSDAFVAGFIGRLAKQKRVEDLIWAVETLRQIRPRLHLVIVGNGPERERLEQFTRDVHCTEQVHFLGHCDNAVRLLPAFDVVCLASSFEGLSNSVMEAMAAGLPVLASDIPPNRELVAPGETGFLFKLADSVGIMQFLRRLIDEPGLGERLGRSGRERIEREFSSERMVEAYAELYRELAIPAEGPQPSPPRGSHSAPRAERLAEFYRRLATELTATSADAALRQLGDILTAVEDELSGLPRLSPPPRRTVSGGRMYPPLDDRVIRHDDGSLTALTRGHCIEIDVTGSVAVFNQSTEIREFPT